MNKMEGGCLCAAVRYAATGTPYDRTTCHCPTCRKAGAAASVAWATFRLADFELTGVEPVRYQSSENVVRTFCGRCGTPLTYQRTDVPDEIDVTICSMDDAASIFPEDHTWASLALPWTNMNDGLARHARSRADGK